MLMQEIRMLEPRREEIPKVKPSNFKASLYFRLLPSIAAYILFSSMIQNSLLLNQNIVVPYIGLGLAIIAFLWFFMNAFYKHSMPDMGTVMSLGLALLFSPVLSVISPALGVLGMLGALFLEVIFIYNIRHKCDKLLSLKDKSVAIIALLLFNLSLMHATSPSLGWSITIFIGLLLCSFLLLKANWRAMLKADNIKNNPLAEGQITPSIDPSSELYQAMHWVDIHTCSDAVLEQLIALERPQDTSEVLQEILLSLENGSRVKSIVEDRISILDGAVESGPIFSSQLRGAGACVASSCAKVCSSVSAFLAVPEVSGPKSD